MSAHRDNLTIVTAVNPEYEAKLKRNFPQWMQMPELAAQTFIVFWNRKRPEWLSEYPNVSLIKWKSAAAGENIRERMLSAFVFGVSEHVSTDYWMKLDADATPTGQPWVWPDYENYTIVGHKCGRTVTKGQPDPPKHFLNQLDDWYAATGAEFEPFPDIEGRGYGHCRVASYCWIERAQHTRELAAACCGRLPVPSQDTCSWYYAWRRGDRILRLNMRKWFTP